MGVFEKDPRSMVFSTPQLLGSSWENLFLSGISCHVEHLFLEALLGTIKVLTLCLPFPVIGTGMPGVAATFPWDVLYVMEHKAGHGWCHVCSQSAVFSCT